MDETKFYGKYRGKVENNLDPQQQGRVQVSCPAVLGDGRMAWAMPCAPYAGPGVGLFLVPPIGADAWIEFEGGDPDYPIYAGGFWNLGDVPALPALATTKLLKTDGASLKLDDLPGAGGVTLEVGPPTLPFPATLTFGAAGIEISCALGKIALGPTGVSVNDGALEVI
ncbi:MAG: phage baseplate assembly protein V [Acidobacteriota bacterium]